MKRRIARKEMRRIEMRGGYCRCGPFRIDIVPKGLLKPYVLKLLSERPMHGFELMEQIFEKSGGMWHPGPAAIYPALESLESEGYIKEAEHGKRPEKSRKQYAITEKGRKALSDYERESEEIAESMQRFGAIYRKL